MAINFSKFLGKPEKTSRKRSIDFGKFISKPREVPRPEIKDSTLLADAAVEGPIFKPRKIGGLSTREGDTLTFSKELGGGQLSLLPITPESKREARDISTAKKAEIRGGSYQETLAEVNHIVGVARGGTKADVNLNALENDLSFKGNIKRLFGIDVEKGDIKNQQQGRTKVEKQLDVLVKSGEISNEDAITRLKGWDFIQELKTETPQEQGKRRLADIGKTLGGVESFITKTGQQVTSGLAFYTNLATLAITKEGAKARRASGIPTSEILEDVSYDKLWADELKKAEDRAITIGSPLEPITNLWTGKTTKEKSIFEKEYSDFANSANKKFEKGDDVGGLTDAGKMAFVRFSEIWSNPFYLFNIRGVSEGSFKLKPQEKVLFQTQLNPAKKGFLGKEIKTKSKEVVYRIDTKSSEFVNVSKTGKAKVSKPDVKLHARLNKNGTVDIKVTNSGGKILNKNLVDDIVEQATGKAVLDSKNLGLVPKAKIQPTILQGKQPIIEPKVAGIAGKVLATKPTAPSLLAKEVPTPLVTPTTEKPPIDFLKVKQSIEAKAKQAPPKQKVVKPKRAKPIKIDEKPIIKKVPREQLPVKPLTEGGKIKASKLEARVQGLLGDVPVHKREILGLSTFQEMNKAENIKAATQFVTQNPEKALDVLLGKEQAPKGILRNSIFIAMQESSMESLDKDLALKLASLESTRFGQELSVLTELDEFSSAGAVDRLVKIHEKAVEKRTGQAPKKTKEATVKDIKKRIEVSAPKKETWDSFIDSIKC